MSYAAPIRGVLMSADIKAGGPGFHRLVFKCDAGRGDMRQVTVQISQDAHRKLVAQMQRARIQPLERDSLLKSWARWEIGQRLDQAGVMPSTVTITASDLDDFGAYAMDLARSLSMA